MAVVKWPVVDGVIPLAPDPENPQKAGGWPFSTGECCTDQWRYVEAFGTMEMTPIPEDPSAFEWSSVALAFEWEWPDLSISTIFAGALLFAQPPIGWGAFVQFGLTGWPGPPSVTPVILATGYFGPANLGPMLTLPDRWVFRLAFDSLAPNNMAFTIGIGDGTISDSYTLETTTTLPWILYGQPGPLPEPDVALTFGSVIFDPEAPIPIGSILGWSSGCEPAPDPDALVLLEPFG